MERFNRPLAERLFGYQYAVEMNMKESDKRSTEWVKRLPEVVLALNNEVTRLIGKKPAAAIKEKSVSSKRATPYSRPVGVDEKKLPPRVNVRYLYQPGELEGGGRRATDSIWSLKVYNIEKGVTKPKEPVMYYFDRKRGIQWTFTTSLEDLDFADDLVLLSHRIQDMRDKTRALEVQGAKVGLKINATKTKLMRIGTKRGDGLSVAGGRIEEVDEFTYLGSIVSKKGGTDEDIQARSGKARQAFAMLRPIWRSTALTTKTKLRVFGSNVKAVLLYGSETWRLTKGLEQRLQVFINKSLRNILRIWWPRKISNKELWRQTGQRPIEQEIRQRAWGWIGHTLRIPDGHVVKRALEWNPQGKRKRGRPQHTWRRTRMAELEGKHLTWNEVKGTAQKRVRWRALVEDLCST